MGKLHQVETDMGLWVHKRLMRMKHYAGPYGIGKNNTWQVKNQDINREVGFYKKKSSDSVGGKNTVENSSSKEAEIVWTKLKGGNLEKLDAHRENYGDGPMEIDDREQYNLTVRKLTRKIFLHLQIIERPELIRRGVVQLNPDEAIQRDNSGFDVYHQCDQVGHQ